MSPDRLTDHHRFVVAGLVELHRCIDGSSGEVSQLE